jgi:hypothetical protein
MIQELPQDRWPELADIFREEFDAVLPDPSATILADVDESTGEIRGFAVLEFLCRIGQIHTPGRAARELFDTLEMTRSAGHSVIAIATEGRQERLCEMYGMYPVSGKVYRRDF